MAAVVVLASSGSSTAPPSEDGQLAARLATITRQTAWRQVGVVPLRFETFHPQGLLKIGADFYLSSVEVREAPKPLGPAGSGYGPGSGIGHLFKFDADGALRTDLHLGEGTAYHPGGVDFDGRSIWVPVSEYRPDSRAVIYKVDPAAMSAKAAFRFDDHIGAVAWDREQGELHGFSWGSRRHYRWRLHSKGGATSIKSRAATPSIPNRLHYVDYQDCHGLGDGKMVCGGVADYSTENGGRFQLGGLEVIDLRSGLPLWQAPVPMRSPAGRPMTQNPVFVEATDTGLRAYFVPDDDRSALYVYDVRTRPP